MLRLAIAAIHGPAGEILRPAGQAGDQPQSAVGGGRITAPS